MTILPNNDAARAIHRAGASTIYRGSQVDPEYNLDQASDELSEEQLQLLKGQIETIQNDADRYLERNRCALDWCCARWPNQYIDGRKWAADATTPADSIWPWPGAADTRDRTVEMVVNERVLVEMFALQNMKVQAESTRPLTTVRESQQMTQVLNWQLFTLLKMDLHREMYLALNWRSIYGAACLATEWEQERRIDFVPVTLMSLQAVLAGGPGVADGSGMAGGGAEGGAGGGVGLGQDAPRLDEMASMLLDPAYEDDLIRLIQSLSPIVTRPEARRVLKDIQQLRTSEIPIPYVFKSQPRVTALRPGVDVFFEADTGDLRHARVIDRVERVTEAELTDRIETAAYDPEFVDEALDHKGETSNESWLQQTMAERGGYYAITPNNRGGGSWSQRLRQSDGDELIELHHVSRLQHDRGTPILFDTVLHLSVPIAARHAPTEYTHGNPCVHALRFEYKQRPILTSEGIPEKAYTWEQELKAQADAQTDRSDLALRPPLLTDSYEEMAKLKAQFMPTATIPVRRHGSHEFFHAPPFDNGSAIIVQNVMAKVDRFFGIFGNIDPDLKQMRRVQIGTDLMTELHPVIMQIGQLDQQLLPDWEVAMVVGPLNRPFDLSRQEIQGSYQYSATINMRMLDSDYLKNALGFIGQLAGMDTMGVLDRAYLVKAGAEMISPDFADKAVQQTKPATQHEQQDEQQAVDLILGSGMDQPLPMGGNYQLREQTLQARVQQALQTNPVVQRNVQQNPEIMQVLQKRLQFFQNQQQQQQNAQIGRMQTTETFTKDAPQTQAMLGSGALAN